MWASWTIYIGNHEVHEGHEKEICFTAKSVYFAAKSIDFTAGKAAKRLIKAEKYNISS